jgi:hypothetical protein
MKPIHPSPSTLALLKPGQQVIRGGDASDPASEPLANFKQAELDVLSSLWASDPPLTVWQLHLKTGVARDELPDVIAGLCAAGSVRKLNTVIESFSAAQAQRLC